MKNLKNLQEDQLRQMWRTAFREGNASPASGMYDPYKSELMGKAGQDFTGQQDRIDRRMEYANVLRGSEAPQGRTVGASGIFTAPNWAEALHYGVKQGLGGYMAGQARKESKGLDKSRAAKEQALLRLNQLNADEALEQKVLQRESTAEQSELDRGARISEGDADRANAIEIQTLKNAAAAQRAKLSASQQKDDDWKATKAERTQLQDFRNDFDVLTGLAGSFRPEFSNRGSAGFVENLIQKGMTAEPNITSAIVGSPVGDMLGLNEKAERSSEELEAEQRWWGLYERLSKIPERARTFGATLTANEQASWDQADIKAGMRDTQIIKNLAIREGIAKRLLDRSVGNYEALGMKSEFTDRLREGVDFSDVEMDVSKIIGAQDAGRGGPPLRKNANAPAGVAEPEGGPPEGISQEEWDELDEDERLFFINNPELF